MTKNKISQHTAILLEHARRCGMSPGELLAAVQSKEVSAFEAAQNGHFEYDELFSYAGTHGEDLEKAVSQGYRMTFNTRNGLKIWIEEAFCLDASKDFIVGDGIIEDVSLTAPQLERLKSSLAVNWTIAEKVPSEDKFTVKLIVRGLQ